MNKKLNSRYDITKTFSYNKRSGPFERIYDKNEKIKSLLGNYGIETDFFGYKTNLPIGVAAGPLYNERYMKGAAKDGFEVITWKTFRSVHRKAHTSDGKHLGHNILFIPTDQITDKMIGTKLTGSLDYKGKKEDISITNSFGMPSDTIPEWINSIVNIEKFAKENNKQVITSVVGTPKENGTIEDLALDYAFLARTAEFTGSKIIELNFSCPNVNGGEGAIFKDIENSLIIAKNTRRFLHSSDTKLLIKMGYAPEYYYRDFMSQLSNYIDGIVAINTIPMQLVDKDDKQALPGGLVSGTCGKAILNLSLDAVSSLRKAKTSLGEQAKHIKIIGCGGVMDPESFIMHIDAGADFVMCATAALFNPDLPLDIAKFINKNKIKRVII
ncbi:MAG: hypothetical protein PHN31_04760 [Candidatus Gracilibacteria bacterium]|nr:hypothetical protein [Candidatus Gracilibacteria bacterium]